MLIVNYHAITPRASRIGATRSQLESDMRGLLAAGFRCVTLDDCCEWMAGRLSLPPRTAAVTFDDGYESVLTGALPLLAELGVPSALFVIAGRLGMDNRWEGQRAGAPPLPLIDREALQETARMPLVTIGAHTWSHLTLGPLDDAKARREIVQSADALEDVISKPVRFFAYPYGRSTRRDRALARDRFSLAFAVGPAIAEAQGDRWEVPRVDCHDLRVALRLGIAGRASMVPYLRVRGTLRYLRS